MTVQPVREIQLARRPLGPRLRRDHCHAWPVDYVEWRMSPEPIIEQSSLLESLRERLRRWLGLGGTIAS